jgi:hypothetical protein
MKRLISLTVLLGLCLVALANAQDTLWTRTYGGTNDEYASSVQQTADGGYIIAGITRSFGAGDKDVYVVKTDSLGDTLWTRAYGGSEMDGAESVHQTHDGGYIVLGTTTSFGAGRYDLYLLKLDQHGDTLWTRTYGGGDYEEGWCVQQTADYGYILAGYTRSYGAGASDFYLIKTDQSGDTLWTRTYGGGSPDEAASVVQTNDSGYILAGMTRSYGGGEQDVYVVKTDSVGDTIWTRTYGGSSEEFAYCVRQTTDGGYVFAGWTESFGAGEKDGYLVKTDGDGDTAWTEACGGPEGDWVSSVQQTADGGYILVGRTVSFGAGGEDVYVVLIDSIGRQYAFQTYGGAGNDAAHSIQSTVDGRFIVAGYTFSFGAGERDMWLLKVALQYYSYDVAAVSIDSPGPEMYYSETYTPKATFSNVGLQPVSPFDVAYKIFHGNGEVYYDSQTVEGLDPLASIQVSFGDFSPYESGTYELVAYSMFSGDENPSNDTTRSRSEAFCRQDVEASSIISPGQYMNVGLSYTPSAGFMNVGRLEVDSFEVTYEIEHESTLIYSDTQIVEGLVPDMYEEVVFSDFSPLELGIYEFVAYSILPGDENPSNDTVQVQAEAFNLGPDTLWSICYGEDYRSNYARQTTDGGFVIAGSIITGGGIATSTPLLIKTDVAGELVWERTYGYGDYESKAWSVEQTNDEGFIFSGWINVGGGPFWLLVVRTDASGDTVWTKVIDRGPQGFQLTMGRSVQQTEDGGFVVAGETGPNAPLRDAYIVRFDDSGDTVWTRTYSGSPDRTDFAHCIQRTTDGNLAIAGRTTVIDVGGDFSLMKISVSGDSIWSRSYGGNEQDDGESVYQTSDGGYVLAGRTTVGDYPDIYLVKTDAFGDTLWTRGFGRSAFDHFDLAYSVQGTNDGGYIVAGGSWTTGTLFKTDSNGNMTWFNVYPNTWRLQSVRQTTDGGYIVATSLRPAAYIMKVKGENQSPVSIGITADDPPIVVPAGGNFTYEGILVNNTQNTVRGDIWIKAKLPNGSYYDVKVYNNVRVPAGQTSRYYPVNQSVPNLAPRGDYLYLLYAGTHPDVVMDSCYIRFTVTEAIKGGSQNQSWAVFGWGSDQKEASTIPLEYALYRNFPNPFNPATKISFDLPKESPVVLKIYNILGQEVETLADKTYLPGHYSIIWDSSKYSSGIYFYRLTAGSEVFSERMMLLK